MTPLEQEDLKVAKGMQALARHIDRQLPYGYVFIVLISRFGTEAMMHYVSNAERATVVRAMYEFIAITKERFGEHVGEAGSGADDEQLARAHQRIAELEWDLKQAVDLLNDLRKEAQ